MNTQHWRFNSNNFKIIGAIARTAALRAIAPMAIILVGAAPLSAQIVRIENRSTVIRPPVNNSIIYTSPRSSPIHSSIVYGSPIPAPVITYPSNFYSYPSPVITYPSNFYSYPNYYPGSVTRVIDTRTRLTNPVLVNPTIRDSTLINPTIINFSPQRRYRAVERNQTILRPINY